MPFLSAIPTRTPFISSSCFYRSWFVLEHISLCPTCRRRCGGGGETTQAWHRELDPRGRPRCVQVLNHHAAHGGLTGHLLVLSLGYTIFIFKMLIITVSLNGASQYLKLASTRVSALCFIFFWRPKMLFHIGFP